MKSKGKSVLYLILGFLLFFATVIILFFVKQDYSSTDCKDLICYCNEKGLCKEAERDGEKPSDTSTPSNKEDTESGNGIPSVSEDQFLNKNLEYETEFLGFPIADEIESAKLNTIIKNINYSSDNLEIVLDQKQECVPDAKLEGVGEPLKQTGFYFYNEGDLILYNLLSPVLDQETQGCTVRLVYNIDPIKIEEGFSISYQNEAGDITDFTICQYSNKLFLDGDVYQASDDCNLCSCEGGQSVCSNKSCDDEEEKVGSVYQSYPDYDKYESPEKEGECSTSSDCFTGGCQSEICSPVNGVSSVCSVAIDMEENVKCGCYEGKCIWSRE